jgi:hypothetical protein
LAGVNSVGIVEGGKNKSENFCYQMVRFS